MKINKFYFILIILFKKFITKMEIVVCELYIGDLEESLIADY